MQLTERRTILEHQEIKRLQRFAIRRGIAKLAHGRAKAHEQEKVEMAGKFELYKDKGGEFRFRLKAGNGENILASEGYKDKAGAENGIASVKKNSGDKARYEIKESTSGKPYFVLKAANHQIIGQSQMYDSASGCQSGIESVMKNAPDAAVDDQAA